MNQTINTWINGLNNIGQGFCGYAAAIFIQSSVLIILLLIIGFLLRKRVRAVFRYCLWMLLFIKLVLPASFTLPTGIGYWLGDYFKSELSIANLVPLTQETVQIANNIPQGYIPLEMPMMNETTAKGIESICWQGLVFLGWLIGMLILLALLVQRLCFVRTLIAQSKPANDRLIKILDECRGRIGIRQHIELKLSGDMLSPAVCGLFKPVILIPATLLEKLSPEKLKTVLIHELAHIKRADIWVNLLQTMLQIVYFYNPFVWIANAMIRRAREQAVDEMVLVTLKPETKSYSNTLIDIGEMAFWRPNFSLRLIGVVESKKALERRINHMLNRPVPKSSKLGILGLFAIIVIGAIILPMACNRAKQTALETPARDGPIADKIIVPGLRVGEYTFDMSKDDVLESLGKPNSIFYGEQRYTLENLPETYYLVFDNVSFRILDDSVKEIAPISPFYRFANGLGVGDSEQKIKQAFGDDFHIKETPWKDFLSYEDKGLVFEIDKNDRTVMEISVLPVESLQSYEKADIPPTSTINEHGNIVDKTDYPFVNDPEAIGGWKSVDFVGDIDKFDPTKKTWQGDLYLNNLIFEQGGSIAGNFLTWTKGLVLSDDTASKYIIREIDGSTYMFFEWKSGDYSIRRMRPQYYVLRKVLTESLKYEPMFGKKAYIPPTSTINEKGYIVDKIDYPFVNDSQVIGSWKSVDYVGEIERFKVGEKRWTARGGKLFLHEMIFEKNGRLISKNGNVPGGYPGTWTKGLVIYDNDTKTASKYTLKQMDDSTYMFYEWKSGDYTFRHSKPSYYVLKKISSETGGLDEGGTSQPDNTEFANQLPAKIEQLDIDTADLEQVKEIPSTSTIPVQEPNSLVLSLSFSDTPNVRPRIFKPGEPINLELIIKNYSKETWSVDKRFLAKPELFIIRNSKGRIIQSINTVCFPVFPITEESFEPGREYSLRRNLFDLYPHISDICLGLISLQIPDNYTVQVVLESPLVKSRHMPNPNFPERLWPENLQSQVLKFTVRDLTQAETRQYISKTKTASEDEVIKILGILGAVRDHNTIPEILSLASKGTTGEIRLAAIMALMYMPDKSIARDIEKIVIEDPSSRFGTYAAGLLGQLNDKQSVPLLIELLKQRDKYPISDDGSVWYSAAMRSLGDIGDPRAIPILTEISENDQTDWVRSGAQIQVKRINESSEQ